MCQRLAELLLELNEKLKEIAEVEEDLAEVYVTSLVLLETHYSGS